MRLLALCLSLLLSGCASAGGPYYPTPHYRVSVHVSDGQGHDLIGARVLIGDNVLSPTDGDGWAFGIIERGRYTLAASAHGYKDHLWQVDVVADMQYGISLEKAQ